jgi:hypothetical protein
MYFGLLSIVAYILNLWLQKDHLLLCSCLSSHVNESVVRLCPGPLPAFLHIPFYFPFPLDFTELVPSILSRHTDLPMQSCKTRSIGSAQKEEGGQSKDTSSGTVPYSQAVLL